MKTKKTVLFMTPTGWAARHLLGKSVLAQLKAQEYQGVVITPQADSSNLDPILTAYPLDTADLQPTRWESLLGRLRAFSLPAAENGSIIEAKYRQFLSSQKMRTHNKFFLSLIVTLLKHSKSLRHKLVELESKHYNPHLYCHLFKTYDIRIVVTAGAGYVYRAEAYLLREAQAHQIPTLCAVSSWDHPSTKGMGGARADLYAAWSPAMRQELIEYHDVPSKRITIIGAPIFDIYANGHTLPARQEFFTRYELDPDQKLILFATNSPVGFPYNPEIVAYLARTIAANQLTTPTQLLIRLHPNHFHPWRTHGVDRYQEILEKFPFVRLSVPQMNSEKVIADMPPAENQELATMMRHADTVVNYFSTVQLDACICNKPIINIGFDWGPEVNTTQRPSKFENYVHLKRVVQTGAVSVAHSPGEMLQLINQALLDSVNGGMGRQQVVRQECGPIDGQAGKRLADLILDIVQQK
jgi:hypothetical protein